MTGLIGFVLMWSITLMYKIIFHFHAPSLDEYLLLLESKRYIIFNQDRIPLWKYREGEARGVYKLKDVLI